MGLADVRPPRSASRRRAAHRPPPQPGRVPAAGSRRGLRQLGTALPFILPSLLGVLVFLLLPEVIVLLLSFEKWNFLQPPRWAGLSNFVTMARYGHVFHALAISAYYVLWNIPVQTAIAPVRGLLRPAGPDRRGLRRPVRADVLRRVQA